MVESLTTGRGTAIGNGILSALDAIAEVNDRVMPVTGEPNAAMQPAPLPPGAYVPDIIVVLTDGVTTTGPDPLEAAQAAADRGVRVYTIGFGTDRGSETFGGRFRRGIDEESLIQIAGITGGEYYSASSASELESVFANLPTYLITRDEKVEISVLFAAVGALFAALAIGLSQFWHPLL